MLRVAITIGIMLLCMSTAAFAQQKEDDRPAGTAGSGIVAWDQILEDIQPLTSQRFGIVVHYILPRGWEVVEQGINPDTGELLEGVNRYVILSRRPMRNNQPTDFVFELSIFKNPMEIDLPANASDDQLRQAYGDQLSEFINQQVNYNLASGYKLETEARDIKAKKYGGQTKSRPVTYFVPVKYTNPEGGRIFTFTSYRGQTIYQVSFLVSDDMVDQHGMLITLMLNNTWALTESEFEKAVGGASPK